MFAAGVKNVELQPKSVGDRLSLTCLALCDSGTGRIDKERKNVCCGQKLVQYFQPFRQHLFRQLGYAGDVATRAVEAGDQTKFDRSPANSKTIGIVVVAAFAASAAGVLLAAITAT